MSIEPEYVVRPCRGHWHVCSIGDGEEPLTIDIGPSYATEAAAQNAADRENGKPQTWRDVLHTIPKVRWPW